MSDEKTSLCIRCPKGCRLTLLRGEDIKIKGHRCKIGEEYGKKEAIEPERVVPTTVRILGAKWPRLPVRTEKGVPLDKIEEVIDELRDLEINAPVKKGDIIVKNVADTSVDIISERDMEVKR